MPHRVKRVVTAHGESCRTRVCPRGRESAPLEFGQKVEGRSIADRAGCARATGLWASGPVATRFCRNDATDGWAGVRLFRSGRARRRSSEWPSVLGIQGSRAGVVRVHR